MASAAVLGGAGQPLTMPNVARVIIDPQLRGHVSPRTAELLRRAGFTIHRVGRAIYAHDGSANRWILGVWSGRQDAPSWAARLDDHHRYLLGRGPLPPREARRLESFGAAFRRARIRDARGRFLARPAWWQDLDGRPQPGLVRPWRLS